MRLYAERDGFCVPQQENEDNNEDVSLVPEEIQDYQIKLEKSVADTEKSDDEFSSLSDLTETSSSSSNFNN